MAARVKLNRKAIARILHNADGGKRAAAQKIFDRLPEDVKAESFITTYHTDREVVGIVIPADAQAKRGAGTRAAQSVAEERDG